MYILVLSSFNKLPFRQLFDYYLRKDSMQFIVAIEKGISISAGSSDGSKCHVSYITFSF